MRQIDGMDVLFSGNDNDNAEMTELYDTLRVLPVDEMISSLTDERLHMGFYDLTQE